MEGAGYELVISGLWLVMCQCLKNVDSAGMRVSPTSKAMLKLVVNPARQEQAGL